MCLPLAESLPGGVQGASLLLAFRDAGVQEALESASVLGSQGLYGTQEGCNAQGCSFLPVEQGQYSCPLHSLALKLFLHPQ